jgi:protein-tyrosine-phosphatase
MALGWLHHLAQETVRGWSGGSEPARSVNQVAVSAMAEVGVDISGGSPQRWTDEMLDAADLVITMGCGDTCPVIPGKRYEDWDVADPAQKPLEDVRAIRDDIERRVRDLLERLGVEAS